MPAIQPRQLVEAILAAMEESGHAGLLISNVREHPRKFIVRRPDDKEVILWVYAWTLTHGGRVSLPDEFRIQMTSVDSPLPLNPSGFTALIGYEPIDNLFAGFDIQKHREFTTGSPSVQIDIRTVRQAVNDGMAFDRKNNLEIAVGIRPDQFMDYVYNAPALHRLGKQVQTHELLQKASALQVITPAELEQLSTEERRKVVREVSMLLRDANFKKQVLHAYGFRCAVSGIQLRLVDAAHILPVAAPGSVDHVSNGIALSPTYHRAFDRGLIHLTENYEMRIDESKVGILRSLNLIGGLSEFSRFVNRPIRLPPDPNQRPNKNFIKEANRLRLRA